MRMAANFSIRHRGPLLSYFEIAKVVLNNLDMLCRVLSGVGLV